MRYLLIVILIALIHWLITLTAKATPPDTLDHFPSYRVEGGAPSFYEQISKTIKYPRYARDHTIIGTAVVSFVLPPEGEITDLKIVNSLGDDIDNELIRSFKETSNLWLADTKEKQNYILFFPVSFLKDGVSYTQTKLEEGFMMEEIRVVAYSIPGSSVRIRNDQDLIKKASKFYQDKNYKKAIKFLDELIRRNPYDEGLYKMRAYCRYQTEDQPGACEDYLKIKTFLRKPISPAAQMMCQ